MDKSRECLYDVKWQVLKAGLHQKWATSGGTNEALLELLAYIGKAQTPYWKFVRVWRVQNLLSTVRADYARQNKAGFREDIQVRKALVGLEIEYNRYLNIRPWVRGGGRITGKKQYSPFKRWNWEKVQSDLVHLASENPGTFRHLQTVSENRLMDTNRRRVALDIPELTKFVALMRDVVFEAVPT